MRADPTTTLPNVKLQERNDIVTQERRYELITPLFGGGVEPAEADPVTVVRATEIRGHLRFWWRATRGAKYGRDLQRMKDEEAALWGAASTKKQPGESQVKVALVEWENGQPLTAKAWDRRQRREVPISVSDPKSPYSYVAFPLQDKPDARLLEGVAFTIQIHFPAEKREEMEAALWAWETFGGIGARTRRGFGAVHLISINNKRYQPPRSSDVQRYLVDGYRKHVLPGRAPKATPHLVRHLITTQKRFGNSDEAWRYLIAKLRDFRQARYGKRFGLSKWPEADAIREETGGEPKGRGSVLKKYPRAKFGLPIIFHFPHDRGLDDVTLKGRGEQEGGQHDPKQEIERLASPLIMRPLRTTDGAVGVAIVLKTPQEPLGGLWLTGKDRRLPIAADGSISARDAQKIPPLEGERDVLLAFLQTL